MQSKFKLPDYSRATITPPTFRPLQSIQPRTTSQTGGFTGLKPFGYDVQRAQQQEEDVDAQIKSLQAQVANLEKRLETVGAGEEVDSRNAFEKFVGLPEGQAWWMDIFELIDRPLMALKHGITEDSWQSAWEAFKGDRPGPFEEGYMSGSDFLENIGAIDKRSFNDTGLLLLDIGFDIFADPLNYIAPIKILKKLGILSDVKIVSRLEDTFQTVRRGGIIQASDEVILNSTRRIRQTLNLADDIDIIKNFDSFDDATKRIVMDELAKDGVFIGSKMEDYARIYGQTIDPTTGRITFMDAPEDVARVLDDATKAYDGAIDEFAQLTGLKTKNAKRAAQALRKRAGKFTDEATELAQEFASANGYTLEQAVNFLRTGRVEQGMTVPLSTAMDRAQQMFRGLEAKAQQYETLAQKILSAQDVLDNAKNLNKAKAGGKAERSAAEQLREYFQNAIDESTGQADEIFGSLEVVVGKAQDNVGADLQLFYRNKDGVYVRMNKSFEIKGMKTKASFYQPTLSLVDDKTIAAAKKAYEALEEGTEAYAKAYDEYLTMVQIYQDAGKVPVFMANPKQIQKYGKEAMVEFGKYLNKLQDFLKVNGISFDDYIKAMDEYIPALKKALEEAGSNPAARKAARKKVKELLPKDIQATLTFTENIEDFHKYVIDTFADELYGFINADNKLILLTRNDILSLTKHQSVTVTTTNKAQQIFFYRTLDNGAVGDIATRNNLFLRKFKEELLGTAEEVVSGQRLVQERVVRKGLIVKMLNGIEKANIPFISPAISLVKKTAEGIAFAFNATKGLEDEFALSIGKLSAEGQVIAKNAVERFEYIVDDIVKRTKGVYKADDVRRYVANILESGWDGVETAGRSVSMKSFVERAIVQFRKTGKVILPKFDNATTLRNFTDELARIFASQGLGTDFFKLTDKGKYSLLEFADGTTIKELEDLLGGLTPILGETQLSFGKAVLSADELRLARQFNDDIVMLYGEQKKIQDILYTELGLDAIPDDVLGTGAYFRHAINPDMLRILKRNSPASIKKFLDAGTDMLRDRMYIGSIDEINAGLKELFNLPIDVFSTDAAYNFADLVRVTMGKREMQLVLREILKGQDALGRPLFEVVDDLEYSVRGMRGQYKILNNSFKAEFPNLFKNISPETQEMLLKYFADRGFAEGSKVIATQKSAYNILKRLDNAYVQLPEFIKSYDQFMKFWKSFALITPGYHMRNLFGNMTNSFLAGMSLPAQAIYLGKASTDFSYYKQAVRALTRGEDLSSLPKYIREAYERVDEFKRIGISQSHRGVKDLEIIKEGLDTAKGAKRSLPKRVADGVVNMNYHLAESMDDMQRYALYQWAQVNATTSQAYRSAKRVGASTNELKAIQQTEAAKKVSEALFDYSHLTPFEKDYMKRLFPFFTFFKNNLIFQAKNIFLRPQQYGKLFRTYKYYTESMTGMDIKDIPDYMSGNLWIPIPVQVNRDDDEMITWLKLNLPTTDFTEFIENPFSRGVTSITTPIKLAIELGTGRDTFTGQELVAFPGQRSRYQQEGILQQYRDEGGRLTISQDPVIIKLLNDLGLRTTINYATIGVDALDYMQGNQEFDYTAQRILDALGLSRTTDIRTMDLAALYQNLDRLRDQRELYEQEVGDLPTLKELEEMFGQPEEQQQRPLFGVFGI